MSNNLKTKPTTKQHSPTFLDVIRRLFVDEGGNEVLREFFKENDERDGWMGNALRRYTDAGEETVRRVEKWYEV